MFKVFECVSHLSAYLPKRTCNTVTPSLLLLLTPGRFAIRGFLFLRTAQEPLQHVAGLRFALPRMR